VGSFFKPLKNCYTVNEAFKSGKYLLLAPIASFDDDDSGITKDTDSRSIDYQQSAK